MNNFKHTYLIRRREPEVTITSGQSGPGINGNEGVRHIPKISITELLQSDAVYHNTYGGPNPFQRIEKSYSTVRQQCSSRVKCKSML